MFGSLLELTDDFFAYNLKYLFLVGLWPDDPWAKAHPTLYKMYEYTTHVLAIIYMISSGIGTYQIKDDVVLFMTNLDKCLVAYNFVAKVVIFVFKRRQVEILISQIINSGDQITEERKKMTLMMIIIVTGLSTSVVGAFSALALYHNEMPVEAWMPFDPMESKMNLLTATQLAAITIVVPVIWRGISMQGIVCSLIMYLCDQLVELQDRIRSLEFTSMTERAVREEFKDIIKKHVRLMGYTQNMNKIFEEYFLIQNLAVTLELCLNALMATMVGFEQKTLLATFFVFLCIALMNAYIYCYLGNEMIIQSENLALAAYESSWISWPLDLQKDLLILLRVAQKPLYLSAGGMVAMSIQTYSQHVAILDIDGTRGTAFQNELNAEYGANKSKFYQCDVTNDDQLFAAFQSVVAGHGGLDLVVNNAGIMNDAPHVYKKEISINVTALITSTLKALELMRTDEGGKGGTVINIASVAGLCQFSVMPIYWATKAAVIQFSNCIGKEDYYKKTGVRVLVMCFGATNTSLISGQKLGSLDKNVAGENISSFFYEAHHVQRMESAAQGVIDAYKKGSSGSTWIATRDLPAKDITDNVNRAYEILGEHI
ncbi:odorant receptor 46a-like isoform X1 [Cydia strobilella]|uniref:odorant receptor 46a-like isoform X1 n=1 Tax=Cydia strobilella TaxID=1100964 RepID=UPI00300633C0